MELDEKKQFQEKVELKGELSRKLIGPGIRLSEIKRKLQRHRTLLKWIEQQRRVLASDYASSCQDPRRDADRAVGRGTRTLRSHTTSETPKQTRSLTGTGRNREQRTVRSILKPVQPARVSKDVGKKSAAPRRKKSTAHNGAQCTNEVTINPQHSTVKVSRLKDSTPPPLRVIHSSRVSKARITSGRKQSAKPLVGTTELPVVRCRNQGTRPAASSARSAGRKRQP
jgi:hypothetical protein